ncbi:hypothetical protein BDN71DRAFT_1161398 [Pleurotus eryngii]|uniref:Uncharacterized protein n=1 Tax=Pleurotus eryngii TaxID=5323 RepID=A0A9P5ZTS3_PLEER|nr:hypothetical protein BDN71DRAFT_1161398 [Pleurotus eryngii]
MASPLGESNLRHGRSGFLCRPPLRRLSRKYSRNSPELCPILSSLLHLYPISCIRLTTYAYHQRTLCAVQQRHAWHVDSRGQGIATSSRATPNVESDVYSATLLRTLTFSGESVTGWPVWTTLNLPPPRSTSRS